MDIITYALSKKYTDQTVVGGGAIKGKNCTVDSIVPIAGGNRVTFRWTLDDGTILTDYVNVMDGEKGDKGDKGDQGDIGFTGPKGDTGAQGIQGIQGPAGVKGDKGDTGNTGATGADGEAATIRIGNVTSGISPSIINSGTAQDAVFDFILPKGDKGDQGEKGEDGADGKSFDIKAQYPNEAALRAAHPTGEAGDAYFVGTDENPDLYVWLTDDNDWFNNGKLAGVKGDKGDKGEKGFSPIAQVTKVGKVATISIRDEVGTTTATVSDGEEGSNGKSAYEVAVDEGFVGTEAEWLASLVGPQGVQGIQGPQGIQGVQGIQGETGIGVPDSGAQGQVLTKKSGINYDTEWKTLGTAAEKNATSFVRPNSHDLVDSNAVYQAINNALSSIYTPHGEIACEDLVPALLIAENVGNIYETSDSGVTTEYFINGSGKTIVQGDSVGIVQAGPDMYLFNLMTGKIDLSEYQKKELETAIGSATTVEDALGALNIDKQSKVLTTAVEGETTVEDALGALSTNKATQTEVNDIVNVLGAKNLNSYPYYRPDSYTLNGLTFTVNADHSVTVSGTATDDTTYEFHTRLSSIRGLTLPNGHYIVNGCPSTGSLTTYRINCNRTSGGQSVVYGSDIGNGLTIELNGDDYSANSVRLGLYIYVNSGATLDNIVFKPMIRLASDPDSTYVPYAMTNQQITPYVQAISNPNLLDNPWFTINQRGESSYSLEGYTVDRWRFSKKSGSTQALTYDGSTHTITIDETSGDTAYFQQRFETPLPAGTYTISMNVTALTGNASIQLYYEDGTFGNNISIKGVGLRVATVQVSKPITRLYFNVFQDASLSIKAVKLELGSVSTLAMDAAPNYQQELAKCQRYFVRLKSGFNESSVTGFAVANNIARFGIPLPTMMRTSPSVTVSDLSHWGASATNAQGALVATAISKQGGLGNIVTLEVTNSNITQSTTYILYSLSAGSYIDFSADL